MKILFTIILSIVIGLSSYSQNQVGANIGYGISYYNIKQYNNNIQLTYTPKSAYEIEINYKKRWPGLLNFGTSVSFQNQKLKVNSSYKDSKNNFDKSVDYKLNNIYIKAFPEFIFGNKIRYYVQIGPSLSIMTSSESDGYLDITGIAGNEPITVHNIITGDASTIFNTFSFGFFGGLGIDIPLSDNFTISASSQLDYSINSWFNKENDIYSSRALIFRIGANYIIREVK